MRVPTHFLKMSQTSRISTQKERLPKSIINMKSKTKNCVTEFDSAALKKMKLCFCAVQRQKSWCFSASSSLNIKERSCFQLTLCSWRNVLGRKMFEEIAHFKQILWNIYKKLILSSQSCACSETRLLELWFPNNRILSAAQIWDICSKVQCWVKN